MADKAKTVKFTTSARSDLLVRFGELCDVVGVDRTRGIEMAMADTLRRAGVPCGYLGWPDLSEYQLGHLDAYDNARHDERLAAENAELNVASSGRGADRGAQVEREPVLA